MKHLARKLVAAVAALAFIGVSTAASAPTSAAAEPQWLHLSANLVVDDPVDLLEVIDEAKAAGANGVLFSDTKVNNFSRLDFGSWEERYVELVEGVEARGMDFNAIMVPLGFCGSLMADRPDLAAGYPIIDQPMIVDDGVLVPETETVVQNGGFENADGNVPTGWGFQDAPGERTFVDRSVARSGSASLRADARDGEMSRLFGDFPVQPNRQYTLSAWIKTENLTSANTLLLVNDSADPPEGVETQSLTSQRLSTPKQDGLGGRDYFSNTFDRTLEWTEVRLAFNSLDAENVRLGLTVFGGRTGSIWWDDISIEATPTLNWLNRDGLDVSLTTESGADLDVGTDVGPIDDPLLGTIPFMGSFETYHDAPAITVDESSGLVDGDRVLLDGWHAHVTNSGQTSCSWNDPATFEIIEASVAALHALAPADGYLMNYSEVRTGGYEDTSTAFATSGEAFASSLRTTLDIADRVTGDADLYIWGDMVDPFHNARDNYYEVAGDLAGAIAGVDAERVTVVNWWERGNLNDTIPETIGTDDPESIAERSVEFFADNGYTQIIGAFYDADVRTNHDAWQEAIEGEPNIIGSLYATWVRPRDFSQIGAFGELWWTTSPAASSDRIDEPASGRLSVATRIDLAI